MNLIEKLQAAPADLQELVENWPLCLDFGLPGGATAVVVGAYQGKVMELLCRLQPAYWEIIGFEPQMFAHRRAQARLLTGGFPRCQVYPWGLGLVDGWQAMGEVNTDAASFVNTGLDSREQGDGLLKDANLELARLMGVDRIDLMVMNIEGYEFALVPYLRKTGWLARIDRLAVQWHLFPDLEVEGRPLTEAVMTDEIALLTSDGFRLVHDRRPAWTHHER